MSSAPRATVRHALIPCGGRGTRMHAVAGAAPKELLPIAGVSLVEWVARECAASGASELLVVTASGKEAIRERLAPHTGSPGFPVRIEFVEQPDPTGLMDAVRLGRAFAGGAPLAVALPDNLFVGDAPGMYQVIETYYRTGKNVVGVVEALAADANRRGPTAPIEGAVHHGDEVAITAIGSKGARDPHAKFSGIGRFVFTDEVWEVIETVGRAQPSGAEHDDVPVLQQLLAAERLVGRRMRGQFLDVGLPAGYEEATRIIPPAASPVRADGRARVSAYTHLIADFKGVSAEELRDTDALAGLLVAAAGAAGLTAIGAPLVRRLPSGLVSGVLLLDGCHMSVHAVPERGLLMLDVLALATYDARKALDVFARRLPAREIQSEQRSRGE